MFTKYAFSFKLKFSERITNSFEYSQFQVQHCAASKCHSEGHCVDKALLTPELLRRYETAHGSRRNCSADVGPSASKVLTAVRSKIPNHPQTSDGNYFYYFLLCC